jgi:hypothetical protein
VVYTNDLSVSREVHNVIFGNERRKWMRVNELVHTILPERQVFKAGSRVIIWPAQKLDYRSARLTQLHLCKVSFNGVEFGKRIRSLCSTGREDGQGCNYDESLDSHEDIVRRA